MNRPAIRNVYMWRFVGRVAALICCVIYCMARPENLSVLEGFGFFEEFTLLHVLWLLWFIDIVAQLIPSKMNISIGSQKNFKKWFIPSVGWAIETLKCYSRTLGTRALIIFIAWIIFIGFIGFLYFKGIIGKAVILIFVTTFYVCDLICVLFWCPFRLFLGNKCCTTCRIFNWDHFMMFTPFLFIPGFFTWTLLGLAIVVLAIWELTILIHPARFWEVSNDTLKCENCTDKLCTQYCGKLPKRNI